MKVLHISKSDVAGGASIAGYRLHQGLLAQGVDSKLLVGKAEAKNSRVDTIKGKPLIERALLPIAQNLGLNYLNFVSSFDIPKHPFYQTANILNFHNLHTAYFNYLAIPALTQHKPAVITLHDMWAFTGHCAYSYNCQRWQNGCGKCPYPDIYPDIKQDNTGLELKLKDWVYRRSRLIVVAPSQWLAAQAQQSILNRFPIHHIPYGIDTEAYQPLEQGLCRTALGIPLHKKVLMFGAHSLDDRRKGSDLLLQVLQRLPNSIKKETILITLGGDNEAIATTVNIPVLNLGYISSDRLKAIAYSAADLFIFPTRADNLPLMLQESMACGTPMVSFKVGGVPDLVRPGITGYLATPEDIEDFSHGIIQLLEDRGLRQSMAQHCRNIAVQEFSLEFQAKRYITLYQQCLEY